jgi:hypothetical protein
MIQHAAITTWLEVLYNFAFVAWICGILAIAILSSLCMLYRPALCLPVLPSRIMLPVVLVVAVVGFVVFAIPALLESRHEFLRIPRRLGMAWSMGMFIASAVGATSIARLAKSDWMLAVEWGLVTAAVLEGTLLVAGLLLAPLGLLARRRERRLYPDLMGLLGLLKALRHLDRQDVWVSLNHRRAALDDIEDAAASIEVGWPKMLRSGDIETAALIGKTAQGIAATIRSLKVPIVLAAPGTRDQLVAKITSILTALATGHWDSIPRQEPMASHSKWHGLLEVLRRLLVGIAPLVLVWVSKWFGLLQDVKLLDWAVLGGVGWFMVTVLLMLDPLLPTKAEAIKAAAQVLTFWRRDKE